MSRKQKYTKTELEKGIKVPLEAGKQTVVRVYNNVDGDHTGPGVEVTWPQYLSDELCKVHSDIMGPVWEPDPVRVGERGLRVKVMARDRSGVKWVDVYLDWQKVGRLEKALAGGLYELTIAKEKLPPEIHAVHAVARDAPGNEEEPFSVPFRVTEQKGGRVSL